MRNWREIEESAGKGAGATPFKQINRGRGNKTFWTEVEVTLLLEKMKGNANNQSDLPSRLEGVETSQSLDLQLALVERQAKDIERQAKELWKRKALEQEARAVKAELELLATEKLLANRTTGLSTYQRIAEAGGFALSDRDDVLGTYGRRV
jgi:hypothetical protein